MKLKNQVIFLIIIMNFSCFAQWKDTALLVKIGSSNYDVFIPIGLNSDVDWWSNGLQTSIGLEVPLNNHFSLQGLFGYSQHRLINNYSWWNLARNDHRIRLYDFMMNTKFNFSYFYLLGGFGLSLQDIDEIGYYDNTIYKRVEFLGSDQTVIEALLGIGLDIKIFDQISIIGETNITVKDEWATNLLIGIKYQIFKD